MSNFYYNNVELPALPETHQHDTYGNVYDYAVICKSTGSGAIYLKFCDKALSSYHESIMDNRFSLRPLPETVTYWAYGYKLNANNEWEDIGAIINPDYVTAVTALVQGVDPQGKYYQNELIWSNHDIMDSENGGVYFAKSDPVLITHYLYNGVKLPALPEYDKEKFPYAFLTYMPAESSVNGETTGALFVSDKPMFVSAKPENFETNGYYAIVCKEPTNTLYYVTKYSAPDEWELHTEKEVTEAGDYMGGVFYSVGTFNLIGNRPLWANHDIYTTDTNELFLAASDPVPVGDEPTDTTTAYRSKNTITLGSGKIYAVEYDGTMPSVEAVCVEANRLGYIKSGASLKYTEETAEEKDDMGYVAKIITTRTTVVLKCGLITWNLNTLRHLLDRYKVSVEGSRRTLKIGGPGNAQGKKYVIVFHHEDKIDGDMWAVIVGRNTAGFTITYGLGAGALIEPEFTALPQPDGTLVKLIEAGPTN